MNTDSESHSFTNNNTNSQAILALITLGISIKSFVVFSSIHHIQQYPTLQLHTLTQHNSLFNHEIPQSRLSLSLICHTRSRHELETGTTHRHSLAKLTLCIVICGRTRLHSRCLFRTKSFLVRSNVCFGSTMDPFVFVCVRCGIGSRRELCVTALCKTGCSCSGNDVGTTRR